MVLGVGPVEAQEVVQVQRVDGDVAIALQRLGVQLEQPGDGPQGRLTQAARQPRRVDQPEAGGQADQRLPKPAPAGLALRAQYAAQYGGQPRRAHQQRLGFDQQRRAEPQERRDIPAFRRVEGAQRDEQRKHGVDLAPGRAVDDGGGVEGHHQPQQHGAVFAQPAAGDPPHQHRASEVGKYRHQLEQYEIGGAVQPYAQQPPQRCHQPQQQHVSRGIVAEVIRGVEAGRSHAEHALGPAGKAVDVGVVAPHPCGKDQPQDQGRAQPREEQRPQLLFAQGLGGPAALAGEAQHRQGIGAGEQQPAFGVALGHARVAGAVVFVVVKGGLAVEVIDDGVLRHRVRPGHRQVVKAGGAPGQHAVAAYPCKHRQRALPWPGAAVQLHIFPLIAGVVQPVGVHEHVLDGQRRAVARFVTVRGADHAADPVDRVRLHPHGLGEAGVVLVHIDDGDAVALVAVGVHVEQAHPRVGQPHVPAPVFGVVAVDEGEVAVYQQVFARLRHRGAGKAEQQKQRQKGAGPSFHRGFSLTGMTVTYYISIREWKNPAWGEELLSASLKRPPRRRRRFRCAGSRRGALRSRRSAWARPPGAFPGGRAGRCAVCGPASAGSRPRRACRSAGRSGA